MKKTKLQMVQAIMAGRTENKRVFSLMVSMLLGFLETIINNRAMCTDGDERAFVVEVLCTDIMLDILHLNSNWKCECPAELAEIVDWATIVRLCPASDAELAEIVDWARSVNPTSAEAAYNEAFAKFHTWMETQEKAKDNPDTLAAIAAFMESLELKSE